MAEQALVIKETDKLTYVQRLGNLLAASGYFSDAREMAQAAVKVMAGDELGIPPIASMMGVHIIKGRVVLGGNLIGSRIRSHGYDYKQTQLDNKGCVLVFLSKIGADGKRTVLGESSFTDDDAKTAGLAGSDNYKKYPRNMFFNRAISNGAKWYTPDVLNGLPVYTGEELGATVDSEGDVVQEPKTAQQQVAEKKLAEMQPKSKVEEPAGLADLFASMTGFEATVNVIEGLKADIVELVGNDREYYLILAHAGMAHSNELKGRKKSEVRAVVRALFEYVEKVRANLEAPEETLITDDDLPPSLFADQPERLDYPE